MSEKSWINERGIIDFEALKEGAERNEAEQAEQFRIAQEAEQAKLRKEKEYWDGLMNKVAADVATDNKKKADAAIAEQLAEAEARIRKEQNKLHHVEEDSTTDKAWRQMLNPTK